MNRFVILSTPRSGTNYFLSKLVTIPELLLAWEPFNRGVTKWFDETDAFQRLPDLSRRALNNVRLRDANSLEFYETAFGRRSQLSLPGITAIGFKLFPQHDTNLFWRLTTDPEVKVIVLERANRFDSFVRLISAYRIWAPDILTLNELERPISTTRFIHPLPISRVLCQSIDLT